ncbi:MAG: flagellar basal body rod protein FlgC [Clostridiales bacterium]|jgi:flagellar basal-body rod protein FlgC|nr:flagellar basal body rod protein FlgC [Clostridiales bacterium]
MSFFGALDVSATALTAQRFRMDLISQNIANAQTTRTSEGGAYRRKLAVFKEITDFDSALSDALGSISTSGTSTPGYGVRVAEIATDTQGGTRVYDPGHPDADLDGYVVMPNVNIVEEMVDMISASRSYEAGVTVINSTKSMIARTMELGR